ncbi:MAG: outer membrane beta-barrel protein [Bacteroidales bacterium]|nr:outer membrane beta-barrel protein [Bacteroidales bacterium]
MKKVLLLLIIFCSISSFAQKGLHLSAYGKVFTSSIINQNVWGVGTDYDYEFTSGGGANLEIGYNFVRNFGLYTGYGIIKLGQKYSDNVDGAEMERELKLNYNVIPVMLKYNGVSEGVNFICGIGIEYAMASDLSQTWTKDGDPYNETGENPITGNSFEYGISDVSDRFESSNILMVFEMGARIPLSENIFLDAMLMGGYGMQDINDVDWRVDDSDGNYNASINAYGAIKIGITYVLFSK